MVIEAPSNAVRLGSTRVHHEQHLGANRNSCRIVSRDPVIEYRLSYLQYFLYRYFSRRCDGLANGKSAMFVSLLFLDASHVRRYLPVVIRAHAMMRLPIE